MVAKKVTAKQSNIVAGTGFNAMQSVGEGQTELQADIAALYKKLENKDHDILHWKTKADRREMMATYDNLFSLIGGLEVYADADKYVPRDGAQPEVLKDGGNRARVTLEAVAVTSKGVNSSIRIWTPRKCPGVIMAHFLNPGAYAQIVYIPAGMMDVSEALLQRIGIQSDSLTAIPGGYVAGILREV